MTTEQKSEAYTLLKISIEGYLNAYKDILIDFEQELERYKEAKMHSLVELKKEHCDTIKGKIEILTELKTNH